MALSVVVTLLLIVAMLATLAFGLSTEFYMMRVPAGPDAMGLIIPLLLGAVAALVTLVAAWVVIARGGFVWIPGPTLVRVLVVTGGVVGLMLLAGFAFIGWSGRQVGPVVALLGSVLLPLTVQGILLALAWNDPQQLQAATWTRIVGWVLAVPAAAGLGGGLFIWFVGKMQRHQLVKQALAEHRARDAEHDRR